MNITRKIDFLLRRLTILRLLYIFLFLTIVFTSYLYGLIQIDSHKLVINILPDQELHQRGFEPHLGSVNKFKKSFLVDYANLDYENDDLKKIIINLNDNSNLKQEVIKKKENNLNNNDNRLDLESSKLDDKIAKLFIAVYRQDKHIQRLLAPNEINEIELQRTKYQLIMAERNKRLREELRKELEANKNKPNDDNLNNDNYTNSNYTGDYDIDDVFLTQLTSQEGVISRDIVIKSIKYEKVKLKEKKKLPTRNVKMLVEEFRSKNNFDLSDLPSIWSNFFFNINEYTIYSNTEELNNVLKVMSTLPVVSCNEKEKGTQIKLMLVLSDGTDVLVKPMKVPREYETPPDHFYFVDFERHHAEIAAFHVDKLLGFNRVPPTVGRVFNMTSDLWEKAESELAKTFFYSPAGNVCVTGHCSYYCDTTHAICGRPKDRMEGSVQLMLPSKPLLKWKIISHPYRRSYNKKKKAEWETNANYCNEKVFRDLNYHSKLLLDIMDLSLFDFLIGNMDRHHYERIISLGNDTFPIHLDNGRAFGRPNQDEFSILEPFKQCCFMRYSTFKKLKYLYKNNFSKLLDQSLKSDPLYPVLTESHLQAIDRRVKIIFKELSDCIDKFKTTHVVIDDGF